MARTRIQVKRGGEDRTIKRAKMNMEQQDGKGEEETPLPRGTRTGSGKGTWEWVVEGTCCLELCISTVN